MRDRKVNKYRNIETSVDGHVFASRKEAQRYKELSLLEKAGEIKELELQPRFLLQLPFKDNEGKQHRKIEYVADFSYKDMKKKVLVIEDVKASATFKTEVYRIKKKLFLYAYQDLIFREV